MKLNLGRRIILFIHWLISLVLLAAIVFPEYVAWGLSHLDWVPSLYMEIASIALLAVYLLLSLSVLCMVFKRGANRADRGFITVDAADTGKVRIAISAIEQMVKQAAYTVDGISDMKISINNSDDAIAININVTMMSGSHVPTVTLNMQRAIRQYVEMNCGVAVRSVSINIQSVTASADGSGKRGKRGEVKPVMPASIVTEQPVPSVKPVEPVVNEPAREPVMNIQPEEALVEYAAVESEQNAAEATEVTDEEAVAAVEELGAEEEKEN